MALSDTQTRFILHWGEMGTRWGINRTVAQIHALLFLSQEPLHAAEIAETLAVARSNVSTSLRELQGWGLVQVVHRLGDRRDHYVTQKDVCEMFRAIAEERKRREVDPTLKLLQELVETEQDARKGKLLRQLLEFFETVTTTFDEIVSLPPETLRRLLKARGKARKILTLLQRSS